MHFSVACRPTYPLSPNAEACFGKRIASLLLDCVESLSCEERLPLWDTLQENLLPLVLAIATCCIYKDVKQAPDTPHSDTDNGSQMPWIPLVRQPNSGRTELDNPVSFELLLRVKVVNVFFIICDQDRSIGLHYEPISLRSWSFLSRMCLFHTQMRRLQPSPNKGSIADFQAHL